jgi:hypothetical protein
MTIGPSTVPKAASLDLMSAMFDMWGSLLRPAVAAVVVAAPSAAAADDDDGDDSV